MVNQLLKWDGISLTNGAAELDNYIIPSAEPIT